MGLLLRLGSHQLAAQRAGYRRILSSDLVDRNFPGTKVRDFLRCRVASARLGSIVCNPPFELIEEFARHALYLGAAKVAVILPIPRINASWSWMRELPLQRVWLITPRPSMPPGHVIAAGEQPKGGKEDYAWLIFKRGHKGKRTMDWLHRDGDYRVLEPGKRQRQRKEVPWPIIFPVKAEQSQSEEYAQ